jgi:hypothetical protein
LDLSFSGGDPTLISQAVATQCLTVTPGATYQIDAKILIPGNTASLGGLAFVYFSSADCSGASIGSFSSDWSAQDTWGDMAASTQIPTSAHSMAVELVVLKPYGQTAAEALFDNIVLVKN